MQTEFNDPMPSTSALPVPTPAPSQPFATPDSTRPSTPASLTAYRIVSKQTTLAAPTPINFNIDPIAFKGLPLEAAQWSFTSDQLREMVSRAIRDSAKEQFIRLLSLNALDKEIPEELARLESLRFTTQAQYRFHFQRRTNLLQSLNALACTTPVSSECDNSTLGTLIQQLAEVTSSMDRFTETLLSASEHRSQLAQVQEKHLSSALAMALRKLNASYAKRTGDLKHARARIAALQAELEEAWKVAEGMAEEIDDLDNFRSDYAIEERFGDGGADANNIPDDDPTTISVVNAEVVPVTGKAIVSKATLVGPPNGDGKFLPPINTNTRRPRSAHGSDRSSRVSAARKRISLISQSAIRLQRSNSEGDGSGGPGVPDTPRNNQKTTSQNKGKDLGSLSPSLLSNPSFLELSRPATPQPSDEEAIPPVPALVRVQRADGTSTSTGVRADEEQTIEDHRGATLFLPVFCWGSHLTNRTRTNVIPHLVNLDYSPGFSAAFDSSMIPPPLPDNDLPSPLTRASSMSTPHLPSTQNTRRIQSMQPSLSIPPSLLSRDQDPDDRDKTGNGVGLQDSPMVPSLRVPQVAEEVHVVPLPEEDDKKPSASHHVYDKSDFWPWTKRNTAILADTVPEPSPPVSPTVDDKVDPDIVVNIGPSSPTPMDIVVEDQEREQSFSSSYLPDMTTPSGSLNGDGIADTEPAVSIIASEDSEEGNGGHETRDEPEREAGEGGSESQAPPSPAASDVPEMPVFLPARNPSPPLERHGGLGSLVARKSLLFRSHSSSNRDKRSSMPLPSAVIASLLPWRGSRRPSSEPELPSQSSKAGSRRSSSLPSPH